MPIRSDTKAALRQVKAAYRRAALFLFNTLLVLLVANAAAALAYGVRRSLRQPEAAPGRLVAHHGLDRVARAYPGWSRDDLRALLGETAAVFENDYEPYVEFRPRRVAGRFVNVSAHGFRRVALQGPWPPQHGSINVFVFGGSTTFGLGVADAETIPSLLGECLRAPAYGSPVRVYNLGRPGYVSAQERVLFEGLLVEGIVPDVAVFVDGLNEFYVWPQPMSADLMRRALEPGSRLGSLAAALPLGRAALALRQRLLRAAPQDAGPNPLAAERVIADWLANRRLLEASARSHGVRTLFVWQPVPCYRYDLRYHSFFDTATFMRLGPAQMRRGYEILAGASRGREGDEGFLWLADLQAERRQNLYVSETHYHPSLSRDIALRIAAHLVERGLLGRRSAAGAGLPG